MKKILVKKAKPIKKSEVLNTFSCAKAIWRKFDEDQKIIYSNIMQQSRNALLVKPALSSNHVMVMKDTKHAKLMHKDVLRAITHNMACLAAWEFKARFNHLMS